MPYVKTNWVAGVTPLSEALLDHLETQYDEVGIIKVRKPVDEAVSNSTVLQNDDHLFFSVAANETWEFMMYLKVLISVGGCNIKYAFAVPAASTIHRLPDYHTIALSAPVSATVAITLTGGVESHYWARFIYIGVANAGNVQLQWAQGIQEVFDTKVLTNSFLRVHKLA